ncbi:MAG: serine/threonine-protein kinase [bacterium]
MRDPHTVAVHDYGRTESGLLFMVLEYVDGKTLFQLIRESGAIAPERVVKMLRQCLLSLQEAHALGVLHRDIKPANIMVYEHIGRADQIKVLDFGIAKLVGSETNKSTEMTAEDVLVGTPRYMSPEQIRGETELTASADIYSLGLVMYELLTGTRAIDVESSMGIIARHLDPDPLLIPLNAPIPGAASPDHQSHADEVATPALSVCRKFLRTLNTGIWTICQD